MKIKGFSLGVILSLLLAENVVHAGIFMKQTQPYIMQDAVWLYSNSTLITSIAPDVPSNRFQNTVAVLDNLPMPDTGGTIGVLYNREDSCTQNTVNQPIPLPFYALDPKSAKVAKVALIKKQEGSCSLVEKIKNAELEGAIGVILYDTNDMNNVTSKESRQAGVPPDSGIKIPAYYVDHNNGLEFIHQLYKMAGVPTHTIPTWDLSNLTTRIAVRVVMMPADNIKSTAWELTLLIMLILLGMSLLFSVCMHLYMWKKNQRLQSAIERQRAASATSPMHKFLVSVTRLYQFPTRTIEVLPDEEERKKVEIVLSDEKQREVLRNKTILPKSGVRKSFFGGKNRTLFRKSSLEDLPVTIDVPVNNMCVVCLEAFKVGDEVRELPCHHEYHCACIDPWLTSKSSECPLCKYDCSDTPSKKTEVGDSDELIAAASIPGIRGKCIRVYRRFKAARKRRTRQVGHEEETHQYPEALVIPSRQSTMVPNSDDVTSSAQPKDQSKVAGIVIPGRILDEAAIAALEREEDAAAAAVTVPATIDSDAFSVETKTSHLKNEKTKEKNSQFDIINDERSTRQDEGDYQSLPRTSMANTRDEMSIIGESTANSIVSSYMTSDGGVLPDIDVSSISLCSIDLENLVDEFTFNTSL